MILLPDSQAFVAVASLVRPQPAMVASSVRACVGQAIAATRGIIVQIRMRKRRDVDSSFDSAALGILIGINVRLSFHAGGVKSLRHGLRNVLRWYHVSVTAYA